MKQGDKISYKDEKGKTKKGVVHGIRKNADDEIIGYLIDTGNDHHTFETTDGDGKKVTVRQPEQVHVKPEDLL